MQILDSVAPLVGRYRGFVLDIWGVVHDGQAAFPGVADALARMKGAGARICFLSNAPRRSHVVERQLAAFGIGRTLYDAAMTSGEITWRLLRDRAHPFVQGLGPRALHIGKPDDRSVVEELGISLTDRVEDADWVLNTGPDPDRGVQTVEPYEALLGAALARDLPMLCVNPDRHVVVGGRLIICAGALSERYARLGGRTLEIGKPDPAAYDPVMQLLDLPRGDCVAIGDSPHTDLAGALAAGLDAVWALGGLAAEEGLANADSATLAARAKAEGVSPVAALRGLRW
ncbi:TIGR01459 family HAD-type hydrolase [Roseomonas sp. SSH11]|uniref:TIGR01459 family HAD-type hydrolase n=1 Tax=Pararoseomonas baculiformis TaxID=2820812 RepID=A0ABS4AI09_9PROT|nr:TIGR01459 family HAD-type hydrolase [Pararoseomonas baculiformis]MBP0446661.1 TIGR01459 family HAD-type hydrolase [Pararoseomonas baculiformis]